MRTPLSWANDSSSASSGASRARRQQELVHLAPAGDEQLAHRTPPLHLLPAIVTPRLLELASFGGA